MEKERRTSRFYVVFIKKWYLFDPWSDWGKILTKGSSLVILQSKQLDHRLEFSRQLVYLNRAPNLSSISFTIFYFFILSFGVYVCEAKIYIYIYCCCWWSLINARIDCVLSLWLIVKPFLVDFDSWLLLLTLRRFSTLKFFFTSVWLIFVNKYCWDIMLNFLLSGSEYLNYHLM